MHSIIECFQVTINQLKTTKKRSQLRKKMVFIVKIIKLDIKNQFKNQKSKSMNCSLYLQISMNYPLQNSLTQQFEQIEQQPIEQSFFNDPRDNNHLECAETTQTFGISFDQYKYDKMFANEEDNTQEYSEVVSQSRTEIHTAISGIHEKYLSDTSPLPKKIFRQERKAFTSQKPKVYNKKSRNYSKDSHPITIPQKLNPLTEGLHAIQVDKTSILSNIDKKVNGGEEEKGVLFMQLGLKQPKTLGKARTERDLQAIRSFLESGQLCSEYVNDFWELIYP